MAKLRIQFVGANAIPSAHLRIDIEKREIQNRLGDTALVFDSPAARLGDVITALRTNTPSVVHFSAHGSPVKEILLIGDRDESTPVPRAAILQLFRALKGDIRLVVFNACFSFEMSEEIKEYIDCVIGVSETIPDDSALRYASQLYAALASGKSVAAAHEEGEILMISDRLPKEQRPQLVHRKEIDPAEVFLFPKRRRGPAGGPPTAQKTTGSDHVPPPRATSQSLKPNQIQGSRIFISYKRDIKADEQLAAQILTALQGQHQVFLDKSMPVGTLWADRIDAELQEADYVIVLLSSKSTQSEMVIGEVEKAYRLSTQRGGRPRILPIRIDYREPFQYPLNSWLNGINWAYWGGEEDTASLIENLRTAIAEGKLTGSEIAIEAPVAHSLHRPSPSAQPVLLRTPGGAMDAADEFYERRNSDEIAARAIRHEGATITIKGSRQMGKSSLLIQVKSAAESLGKQVAFLDFQLLDASTLLNPDLFFRQFCSWLSDSLQLPDRTSDYWSVPLGNAQRCTRYVRQHVLPQVGKPLLIALDEVDRLLVAPFRSDFFGMLRSWHNGRASDRTWRQVDLSLVISTEPHLLIDSDFVSPFNVGDVIDMRDFTETEAANQNRLYGSPLDISEMKKLMDLLGGHPYLIRRALYMVAGQKIPPSQFFSQATTDDGPFGDHLRYYFFLLSGKSELIDGFRQILRGGSCKDESIIYRLKSAGLIRTLGSSVRLRCELYSIYFRQRLEVQ